MKTISQLLDLTFAEKKFRNWDKLYWCIDLHSTIITGTYNKDNHGYKVAPGAIEVLQRLTKMPDQVLILWTSSYFEPISFIKTELFDKNGIKFNYFNRNPECPDTELCDFSQKFYFNILLDDKSGWDMDRDWLEIKQWLDHNKLGI